MNVNNMVVFFLKQEGYDGLYAKGGECACEIADIAPCGEITGTCLAGYRYWCEDIACEYTKDVGKHWHMRAVK
jgi:hypothetical protein